MLVAADAYAVSAEVLDDGKGLVAGVALSGLANLWAHADVVGCSTLGEEVRQTAHGEPELSHEGLDLLSTTRTWCRRPVWCPLQGEHPAPHDPRAAGSSRRPRREVPRNNQSSPSWEPCALALVKRTSLRLH
ncbi:hypothetical protein NPS01_31160 [Nocardioides psychrotolerans]|nr:hypothetical protein NPS01_31160 [Nocardioides psychrotolerans]